LNSWEAEEVEEILDVVVDPSFVASHQEDPSRYLEAGQAAGQEEVLEGEGEPNYEAGQE
jgi:hypothetical protein